MESVQLKEELVVPLISTSRLEILERRNLEMEASMRYAGNLQQSILPNELMFKNCFSDAFVIFEPKDIVSGDFYWIFQHHSDVYFAVGDCTGHGIPGALVNIAGNTILRQIIRLEGVRDLADYTDQFGGTNVKKFNGGRFRKLISYVSQLDMKAQKKELLSTHKNWRANMEQIDDVCVLGIKI